MTDAMSFEPAGPPAAGDEVATLVGSLNRQRNTFVWKVSGLDSTGMQATLGASTMTLGGLVKHLALVEDDYFCRRLRGQELDAPWRDVDWDADPDWEWRTAARQSPDELLTLWRAAVQRSQTALEETLAAGGLDQLGRFTPSDGRSPNLRRMLVDLIEEYARHTGHADLIRESIDGLVGDDPPA